MVATDYCDTFRYYHYLTGVYPSLCFTLTKNLCYCKGFYFEFMLKSAREINLK